MIVKDVEGLLFRNKPLRFLLKIAEGGDITVFSVSLQCELAYSHALIIYKCLKSGGLVARVRRDGRSSRVSLTENGVRFVSKLKELQELMKGG